jgi:hypothetical protein
VNAVENDSANEGVGENEMELEPSGWHRTGLLEVGSSFICRGAKCGSAGRECSVAMAATLDDKRGGAVPREVLDVNAVELGDTSSGDKWRVCYGSG